MKKILIIATIIMFACTTLSFAAASQAPTAANDGQTIYGSDVAGTVATTDAQIARLSTGVYLGWLTGVDGYTLITQHKSGTRSYGSAYDSTALYRNDTVQTAAPTSSVTATAFGSGWTEM